MAEPRFRMPLQIVLYKEQARWIAHCLEFDLLGDGETEQQAVQMLATAVGIQLEDALQSGNMNNLFCPADGKFFQIFAEGRSRSTSA